MMSERSPEATVEAAFRAFRARDGYALAALASPSSLQAFRDSVVREAHPQWHVWTPEALRAHDPRMPLEVAEWQVKEMERSRVGHEESFLTRFPGTGSIEEFDELSAEETLHRALLGAPDHAIAIGWCRILGHVLENETRSYALFWLGTELEPMISDYPAIAALERIDNEWRLALEADRWGIPGFRNMLFFSDNVG